MKKKLLLICLITTVFGVSQIFSQTNLLAGLWDGNGVTGVTSKPNDVGWTNSVTASIPWTVANGSGGSRFRDYNVAGGHTGFTNEIGGATSVTRQMMFRWDNAAYSTSFYAYPVTLVSGKFYKFSMDYVLGGSGTPPNSITVGISSTVDGSGRLTSKTFTTTNSATIYRNSSYEFNVLQDGVYYINFNSALNAWYGVTNLSIIEITEIDKSELLNQLTIANGMASSPEPVGTSTAYADLGSAISAAQALYENVNATPNQVFEEINILKLAIAKVNSAILIQQRISTWTTLPYDATSVIVNPTVEGTDNNSVPNGWTATKGSGNTITNTGQHYSLVSSNRYFDSWNGTAGAMLYTAQQTIKNIPNGVYKLKSAARTSGSGSYLYAKTSGNTYRTEIINVGSVGGTLGNGFNTITVQVPVLDNTMTIGVTTDINVSGGAAWAGTWFSVDDFTLSYISDGSPYIYLEPTTLAFNPTNLVKTFEVTGGYLTADATLVAPAGITLDKTTLTPAEVAAGVIVTATFNNTTVITNGSITITSGAVTKSLTVNTSIDPVVITSLLSMRFDEVLATGSFTVTGSNLANDITITAPTGVTVNPTTIAKGTGTVNNVVVNVTYDGTTPNISGNIVVASGVATKNVAVVAALNSNNYTPLYTTLTNIMTNTYCNSLDTYAGWGAREVVSDYVYSGARSIKITGRCGGSLDYILTGKVQGNKTYRVKAMVSTNGTGEAKIGVSGATVATITNTISTAAGEWLPVDFTFTTQETVTSVNMYLNSCESQTALVSYIDNFEMYDITSILTGVKAINAETSSAFVRDNKVVVKLNLELSGEVELSVYNVNGMLIDSHKSVFANGYSEKELNTNLNNGIYFVKVTSAGKTSTLKVVK